MFCKIVGCIQKIYRLYFKLVPKEIQWMVQQYESSHTDGLYYTNYII